MTTTEEQASVGRAIGIRLKTVSRRCAYGAFALTLVVFLLAGLAIGGDTSHPIYLVLFLCTLAAAGVLTMVPILVWLGAMLTQPILDAIGDRSAAILGAIATQTEAIEQLRGFIWHHGYGKAVEDLLPEDFSPPAGVRRIYPAINGIPANGTGR